MLSTPSRRGHRQRRPLALLRSATRNPALELGEHPRSQFVGIPEAWRAASLRSAAPDDPALSACRPRAHITDIRCQDTPPNPTHHGLTIMEVLACSCARRVCGRPTAVPGSLA